LTVRLAPRPADSAAASETTEQADPTVPARQFDVRLYFVEPNTGAKHGERVFDVAIQGDTTVRDFDVVAEAGGSHKAIVRTWQDVSANEVMEIDLTPRTAQLPILCGVEIIEHTR
jgi:hypothetical protein